MRKIVFVCLMGFCFCPAAGAYDRVTGRTFSSRSRVMAANGMAATSQPLATQAALDILRQGGNAIDAAIAANAVLGLTEPTGCGIGGDLFALIWDAKAGKLLGLNASGRSPWSLTLEHFKTLGLKKIPPRGSLPVTVPGCVDGWFEMHAKLGKLPMKAVLAPAIRYAREGFPVSDLIAFYWAKSAKELESYEGFKETFMPAPKAGEIFRNPNLAETLEKIAEGGRDVFYRGEIARAIDAFMKRVGGFLSYRDLSEHRSEWVEPISTSYRGYDIWELPPNGQGFTALQILNILEGYDIREMGFGSSQTIHHFVEAKKLAFEDRAKYCADPEFNEIPVGRLISKEYAAERRKLIDPRRAAEKYPAGDPCSQAGGDTVYLTVADREGNMVSLIQSNYRGMGCGLSPNGLGFILQDRGELFALEEGRFNTYAPRKRPFHTIIPAFITRNGRPWMSFGVMGGDAQPQIHAQIVINMIDFGMDVQEAGDAPRILHEGSSDPTGGEMTDGGTVYLETGIPYENIRDLVEMGHRVAFDAGGFGGYQAIRVDGEPRVYSGASESRKDGQAAGY
jgi:gamma-glutamyltranspeptidase/glutathione hydrolase